MNGLSKYLDILIRRKLIFLLSIIVLGVSPFLGSYFYDPVYKGSAQLKILLSDPKMQYAALPYAGMEYGTGKFEYVDKTKVDDTFFEMLKNSQSLKKLIDRMGLDDEHGKRFNTDDVLIDNEIYLILKNRGVNFSYAGNNAEIIEVTGYSTKPSEAVDIANNAADIFMELYAEIYRNAAKEVIKSIDKRMKPVQEEIENYEKEKNNTLKAYAVLDVKNETANVLAQYYSYKNALDQALRTKEENRKKLEEINAKMKQIPELELSSKIIERNTLIDNYKIKIIDLETSIAKLTVDLTELHPNVIAAKRQIDSLRNAISKEIGSVLLNKTYSRNSYHTDLFKRYYDTLIDMQVSDLTIKILGEQIKSIEDTMFRIKEAELSVASLDRKISSLSAQFSSLVSGRENAELILEMKPSNVSVLNYADVSLIDPESPYFPNRKIFLYVLLAISLIGGFAITLVAEYIDKSLKSLDEAMRAFPAKLIYGFKRITGKLGMLPKIDFIKEMSDKPMVGNIALNIISGIHALSKGGMPRFMLFTGAEANVGTTSTAFIIAKRLALQGKATLFFNLSSKSPIDKIDADDGFSDRNISLKHLIKLTETKGLDIINRKKELKNHILLGDISELLRNIEEVKNLYDFIIFDTDTVKFSNDTIVVSNFVDAVVVVVRFRKTQLTTIHEALGKFSHLKELKPYLLLNQI